MSVLTGLISGAAKGAAEAGKVVMDQELKKQLLEIQAQKELMLAEARSRLNREESQFNNQLAIDSIAPKAKAQTAADIESFDAKAPMRATERDEELAKKKLELKAETDNTIAQGSDPKYLEAKKALTNAGVSTGQENYYRALAERQFKDSSNLQFQTMADGKVLVVKGDGTTSYLQGPDGKPVEGLKDVPASTMRKVELLMGQARALEKDPFPTPETSARIADYYAQADRLLSGGAAPAAPGAGKSNEDFEKRMGAPVTKTPAPQSKPEAPQKPAAAKGLVQAQLPDSMVFKKPEAGNFTGFMTDMSGMDSVQRKQLQAQIAELEGKRNNRNNAQIDRQIAELKAQMAGVK